MSLEGSNSVITRCPWGQRHPPKGSANFDAIAKSYVGHLMAKRGLSAQIANSRYGVPLSTLYEWKKAANKGLQHNGKGRRPLLEECDIESLRAECEDDSRKGISWLAHTNTVIQGHDLPHTRVKVLAAIEKCAERHNVVISPPADKTITKWCLKVFPHKESAKEVSEERNGNICNVFNCVTHFLSLSAANRFGVDPSLFINFDATSFQYAKTACGIKPEIVRVKLEDEDRADDTKNVAYANGTQMACQIKIPFMISGNGVLGPTVYVIKDTGVPKGECVWVEIDGFNPSHTMNGFGTKGFIAFMSRTVPNQAFYDHYLGEVLPKFIAAIRADHDFDLNKPAAVFMDGESDQVKWFEEPKNANIWVAANIIVFKSPAGCTGVYQMLDVGKLFPAAKSRLKNLSMGGHEYRGAQERNLERVFKDQIEKYGKYHSTRKGQYIQGIRTIHSALLQLRQKVLVMSSFRRVGADMPITTSEGWWVDPMQIAKQARLNQSSREHVRTLGADSDRLQSIFMRRGYVTDREMWDLEVVKMAAGTHNLDLLAEDKSRRPLNEQRGRILQFGAHKSAHEAFMKREAAASGKEAAVYKKYIQKGKAPPPRAVPVAMIAKTAATMAEDPNCEGRIQKIIRDNMQLAAQLESAKKALMHTEALNKQFVANAGKIMTQKQVDDLDRKKRRVVWKKVVSKPSIGNGPPVVPRGGISQSIEGSESSRGRKRKASRR